MTYHCYFSVGKKKKEHFCSKYSKYNKSCSDLYTFNGLQFALPSHHLIAAIYYPCFSWSIVLMQKSLSWAVSSWMTSNISECKCIFSTSMSYWKDTAKYTFFRPQSHNVYQQVNLQLLVEIVSVSIWWERRLHNINFFLLENIIRWIWNMRIHW